MKFHSISKICKTKPQNLRAVTDNEKQVTDGVKALQIASALAFSLQLVWSLEESVSQIEKKNKNKK